ncbi:MAG: hypothetical protein LUC43_08115 [Burkholderiales bacterium]|nr:hypothetical protein [Burkholderiales bacterium]
MISTRHVLLSCSVLLLFGCAEPPGEQFRSDVYSAAQVNQAQEVQTVDIISLQPAKIAIPKWQSQYSYRYPSYTSRNPEFTEGVQITFKVGDRVLNSAQVGRLCESRLGPAIMVSTHPTSARVQPNNPAGCGKDGSYQELPPEENI